MPAEANKEIQLAGLQAALPGLRPELHRYCARMTGSVIDGEDVLQEALLNAARALRGGAVVNDLRAWLFRIAHNTAMSHFRSRKNDMVLKQEIGRDLPAYDAMPSRSVTADTLRPFLGLTPKQRSTVILRDVLGYSAAEVADLTESSVQSVKSALHRGRVLLRKRGRDQDGEVASLSNGEREQLDVYARCFNAHDFDRLRDMLSSEVHLELVSRENREGKAGVSDYYGNYQKQDDWVMAPGQVEGRPAILAFDRADPAGAPTYFVLLDFKDGELQSIRDFRYARYAIADAQWERL